MPGIHRRGAASYFTDDIGAGMGTVVSSTQQPIRDPSPNTRASFLYAAVTGGSVPMRLSFPTSPRVAE
jgi:hypothetical protein